MSISEFIHLSSSINIIENVSSPKRSRNKLHFYAVVVFPYTNNVIIKQNTSIPTTTIDYMGPIERPSNSLFILTTPYIQFRIEYTRVFATQQVFDCSTNNKLYILVHIEYVYIYIYDYQVLCIIIFCARIQ